MKHFTEQVSSKCLFVKFYLQNSVLSVRGRSESPSFLLKARSQNSPFLNPLRHMYTTLVYDTSVCEYPLRAKHPLKPHSHGQICICEYLFAYMQIYSRVQICPFDGFTHVSKFAPYAIFCLHILIFKSCHVIAK